ncbi:unnamed protein product [Paramecium primaurelia]|uniref:Uncharacterized protein n=1 Tax=Paramecium primaurelia TaxID=5886 RepID=A0A8S1JQG8_PARPR|nr:unnamed protein product [Paramecium primaurelia]
MSNKKSIKQKENIPIDSRLNLLESNLNRVCMQHDALMPIVNEIPHVQKLEQQIKILLKKQEELEKIRDKSRETSTNTSFSDFKCNSQNKPYEKQLNDLTLKMNYLENQLQDLQKKSQGRVEQQFRMFSDTQDIQRLEQFVTEELNNFRSEVQLEYKNIYKELNGLRCDLEYIMNNTKKNKVTQKIQTMNVNPDDKLFVINLLEQETIIEELDHYENENTFRLLYELDYFEQQRESISTLDPQQTQRESLYLEEKLISLKYQLAASKRKYLFEIKKIEHKFQVINEIIEQNQKYLNYQQQIHILTQRMSKIVTRVHQNIECIFQKISTLDKR